MLAFIFAPFYILVNVFLVRWLFRWMGACHGALGRRGFHLGFSIVYAFIALTPLTSFLIKNPAGLHRLLKQISNYWLGWLLYLILGVLVTEALLLAIKLLRRKSFAEMQPIWRVQGAVMVVLWCSLSLYGMWGAKNLHTTTYEMTSEKVSEPLTIALIADLHLGYSTDPAYVEEYAQAVSDMDADLVLVAGDIFDNEYEAVPDIDRVCAALGSMKSRYGTYACWGNHDLNEAILAGFTWNTPQQDKADPRMTDFLERANMALLVDEVVEPLPGVVLVGRQDPARGKKLAQQRKNPVELSRPIDQSKLIIDLEHEPGQLQELADCGFDLQVAGHTHDGQMFPGNLTIRLAWENPAGQLQKDNMTSIVTSGVGVWGPNMRVGTRSEVCKITINPA